MTLNVNDQLTLLYDLLDEQHSEDDSNISEYQQIRRLIKSMMANNKITDEQLLQLLPEIYHYGRQGEHAQNVKEHITTNKENIQNWLAVINQTTIK